MKSCFSALAVVIGITVLLGQAAAQYVYWALDDGYGHRNDGAALWCVLHLLGVVAVPLLTVRLSMPET